MDAIRARGAYTILWPGKDAYIRFTFAAQERLHEVYGEKHVDKIIAGIKDFDPGVIKECLKVGLKGATVEEYLDAFVIGEIETHLMEALCLSLYGRTWEEQIKFEDAQSAKQMQRLKENPQLREMIGQLVASAYSPKDSEPD